MESVLPMQTDRIAIEELVYRSCLALDEKDFKAYLDLCDESFRYTITAHSPEIRKDMIWLDHDKPEMQLLFNNLPQAHQRSFAAVRAMPIVYTVEPAAEQQHGRRWCRRCRCSRRRSTAARRSSSRSGATSIPSASTAGSPKLLKRVVRLETRQFGFGYHIPF